MRIMICGTKGDHEAAFYVQLRSGALYKGGLLSQKHADRGGA